MKKFGISDNIIVMDDDCFINKKLKKDDFFYVNKGKVIPSIITSSFIKINQEYSQENRDFYEKKVTQVMIKKLSLPPDLKDEDGF
jgi:hypothetical protein